MTRLSKGSDGMYHVNGRTYKRLIGSRAEVFHGTAYKTTGGLVKSDLMQNKHGRIVSEKKHKFSKIKKNNNLLLAGYGAEEGKFGMVRVTPLKKTLKNKKGKKGGAPYGSSLVPQSLTEGIDGQGITNYGNSSTDVQFAAGMAGGRRRHSRKHHRGGSLAYAPVSAVSDSMSATGRASMMGLTQYPNNSTSVQIQAGMAGGRRRRGSRSRKMRGGTTKPSDSGTGTVAVQIRAGQGN